MSTLIPGNIEGWTYILKFELKKKNHITYNARHLHILSLCSRWIKKTYMVESILVRTSILTETKTHREENRHMIGIKYTEKY